MSNTIFQYVYKTNISGNVKPTNNHLVVEKQDQTAIYFVDSVDTTVIKKLITSTGVISTITDRVEIINALWYDRINDYIYCIDSSVGVEGHIFHIVLSNDSIVNDETIPPGTGNLMDVFKYSGITYTIMFIIYFHIGPPITTTLGVGVVDENSIWYYNDMGYTADPNAEMSFGVLINDYFYFLIKSSGKNVELWKWQIATGNWTLLMDCGASTDFTDSRNMQGISYDNSNILYFILKYTGDNKNYLCTYVISTYTFTKGMEYNVSLILDRNTKSTNTPECFALEKAFAISLTTSYELKLYQISRTRENLNYLGKITLGSGDVCVAITDYFLIIDNSGTIELWKFEDVMGTCIVECNIDAEERTWTSIDLIYIYKGAGYQDAPTRDQLIQVFGRYSSYTLGAPYYGDNLLIAEGLVRTFNLDLEQEVRVESLAQEELAFAPNITSYTNYTGKTSGAVITQLLLDYCKTITAGTIVNGSITWTCPADWSVAGDKSLEVIFNELADSENFSWRLRPNCKLDFDAGTVDSQRDFNPTDTYSNQEARLLSQQINQIIVYGGFVNGVQVGPYYANDTNHQLLYGNIVKWSKTYSGIFDATALQTIATNKLAIQGAKPLVYWAERYCTDWGFIQPGETIYLGGWYFGSPDSFWEETVGDSGTNIAWVDSATLPNACTCTIIAELDNHKNVLKLTHDGGGSTTYITHNITATPTLIYEWWWACSDVTKECLISFREAAGNIVLSLDNSKYYYYTVGSTVKSEIVGAVPTNNILTHFKISLDCATDLFQLYINGTQRVTNGAFNAVATAISSIRVQCYENAAYSQYISAPSDVADADYDEGDNLIEHSRIKVSENSTQELPIGTYIVNRNKFDAKNNISEIKISDGMLFLEDGSETLSEQNSELIQQIADYIAPSTTKEYYVSTDAELDAAIVLIEAGNYKATIIQTADLTNVQATFNDPNIDITIDGQGHIMEANGDNTILTFASVNKFQIKNVVFNATDITTSTKMIVQITTLAKPSLIEFCEFYEAVGTKNGIGVYAGAGAPKVIVEHCNFYYIYDAVYVDSINCKIRHNYIKDVKDCGIYIGAAAHDCSIIDNDIEDIDCNGAGACHGILVKNGADRVRIESNAIDSIINSGAGAAYGILIEGANSDNCIVVGNGSHNCKTSNYTDSGTSTTAGNNDTT